MERVQSAASKAREIASWRQRHVVFHALTALALVALWEFIGRAGLLLPDLFPSIPSILQASWEHISTSVLMPHLKASLYEVAGGLLLGALSGIPFGLIFGTNRSLIQILEPLVLYLAVVPKIIIFPIFILFLGIGTNSKLAVGAIAAFFPIALLTLAGMREIRAVYLDVGRSFGAGPLQLAAKVYLPALAGYMFAGLRIGMGAAVTGALLAETKVAKAGLGFLIVEYYSQFRVAEMYSLLLLIFLLAAAANWAMKASFSLLLPLPRTGEEGDLFL